MNTLSKDQNNYYPFYILSLCMKMEGSLRVHRYLVKKIIKYSRKYLSKIESNKMKPTFIKKQKMKPT